MWDKYILAAVVKHGKVIKQITVDLLLFKDTPYSKMATILVLFCLFAN